MKSSKGKTEPIKKILGPSGRDTSGMVSGGDGAASVYWIDITRLAFGVAQARMHGHPSTVRHTVAYTRVPTATTCASLGCRTVGNCYSLIPSSNNNICVIQDLELIKFFFGLLELIKIVPN